MKPELDDSLLTQFHVPIIGSANPEQATPAMPVSDAGFRSLEGMLGGPMGVGSFLCVAIAIASALGRVHQHRLVHKDIKPANILVNPDSGEVRFTGFGLSSRIARERPQPRPPESIAGTLAYMAPEQTGRMNRSIDSRSDLYALGVTLYQMLTGSLPFTATDPMEWVHCHIARKPVPPSERLENVPAPVSAIIMRLLVKTPEDRYQTAGGVGHDLRRCLAAWDAKRRIDDFPLGEHDIPDRLLVPEKLYGRSREVETLLTAFDRMVTGGKPELVLVSGYSGIGKSSVVNELHKVLVMPRGLFASGKFDQYKRDIPYATLAQAFQGLVRYLLGKSDAELSGWRDALADALGPNGPLMIDLVPELKLIIGEQPPVPVLSPQDARSRFQVVFRRFIGVFARRDHPLALFLDDLQWLDAATLDILEDLLTPPGVPHLMLIGAYRDNEVTAAHPLTRKLEAIRNAGANVHEIALAPLACEDVRQLVADALRCDPARATPLAQLVHGKTAGNPFFVIQFLSTLAEDGWLAFDHEHAQWSWDLDRIHAKQYRDNVVDLMVGRLNRLPLDTQRALQQLACLGNIAPIRTLSLIIEKSAEDVGADLWDAVRLELVEHLEGAYQFVHDRVQEAAYSLIPEAQRDEAHLRIGRRLAAHLPPELREEAIFDIVNQFNRGTALIISRDEREQVAELNLLAGKRAKASAAYASALKYLVAGAALQPADSWERQHAMSFELELHRAECEFLTGALAVSEERLKLLSARAANTVERARVASLRVNVYTTLDQSERAVEVCLEYLGHLGVEWPPHPAPEQALDEYQRIWSRLGARRIEDLIDLPLMSDSAMLGTLDVLTEVVTPALFTDRNLLSLVICRMVNLSLEHGNSDGSCFAFVFLGMIAGPHFDKYEAGFQFGRLGYELVERRGLHRYQARTYMCFGNLVMPWTKHVRTGRDLVRRAFDAANKAGDLTFAAYSRNNLNTNLLAAGDRLVDAQREAEEGLDFAQKARFGLVIDIITAQLGLIRMLRGLTPTFGSLDHEQFDERRFESHLASQPDLALPECWYWIRKLQARVLAGDYRSAIDAASKAQPLLWTSPSFFETAEYEFYGGLARAGFSDSIRSEEQPAHRTALSVHHKQLEIWATHCPENFESRAALVGAEIARIEGRVVDAEQLYEQTIRSAHEHGFVQNEGLGYELAARFYAARGFDDFAHLYLLRARHCYARWGADGKVRQLDERYRRLREEDPAPDSRATIGEPVERLELATVLKVSQAVSGEIVLEKLVDTVLRTAIEHAGAERGLLLLPRGGELLVRAEGETRDSSVAVRLCEIPVSATELPESVVRYAARTREAVILADASARNPYSSDEYIRATTVRSVLCLPLVKQGSLVALLYLENRLASSVFTPSRIALLEVLASQAAVSLENSGLYRKLQQSEAEIRRLVDANVVGVMIWALEGRILEANDAFLRMVGYERADLVSGRLRWTDLTPAEWRERDEQALAELNSTGTFQPFEKEYFRKDGSRVPVLIGGAAFDEESQHGVAFVVDITARKCAEEDLKRQRTYLDELFDLAPDAIVLTSINNPRNLRINQEFTRMFGYTSEEAVGRRLRNLIAPDDLQPSNLTDTPDLLAGKTVEREVIRQRKDGTRFHAHITAKRVSLPDNEDAAYIIYRDITERKRAEAILAGEKRVLEMVTRGDSLPRVLESLCELVEEQAEGVLASVLLAQNGRLVHGGAPSLPKAYIDAIDGGAIGPSAGSCGTAAHRGEQVIVSDIATDPLWADYREAALSFSLRACWSTPLFSSEGNVIGTFAMYYREPRSPSAHEQEIIERITHLAGVAIQRKVGEEDLRRSQHYLAEAQKAGHTGSWAWSPVSNVLLYWSEECYRILGYDPAQGLPSFESSFERIHPDDRPAVAEVIERAVRGKTEFQIEYRLVLPDGTRRNVRILSHPVLDSSGKLVEFVGTVMDVTDQKRAEEERREHLWFLECMDRINRATQRTSGVEGMMSGVLEETLAIFSCDRARLVYPCDPDASTSRVVMEHSRPEYPGAFALGEEVPMDRHAAEFVRRVLDGPGAATDLSISPEMRERFRIQSAIAIAVRPKGDRPYLFGLHQCSHARAWTAAERRLFEEIARRLEDALTSVLAHRNLLASEKELRRSQQYLAEAQKLTHTGSWAWNPISNAVLYWSAESYRIYGFDPAQGIPPFETTWERVHPEDRDALREAIERGVREKAALNLEHRLVLPGGIVRNHHVLAHPVLNASGELIEYLGTVVDVTEQKRAEEERKEHLWFLECMDRVNRAMQRTNDVEGMMRGVLEETLALFGCDRAWLVYPCDPDASTSRVVMEHTRPEYPGAFALGQEFPVDTQAAELVRRVLDGPGAATDLSIPPEIRERFNIQSVIAIAVRPKGDRPYLLGLHQCSHARAWTAAERRLFEEIARRLEDALTSVLAHRNLLASQEDLRASEQRFRTFVDHATDAFFLYDEECIVLDVNRQACEALGYTREELIGMHPTQFNEDMTQEGALGIKQRLREHGSATFSGQRRRKDGSLFPVEERLQAFNRGGRVFGIGLASDITDRRRREQRLLAQYRVTQTLSKASSLEEAAPLILRAMCEVLEWDLGAFWQVDLEGGVLRCTAAWSSANVAPSFAATKRMITFGPGMGLPGRVWSSGGPVFICDVALEPELPRARFAAKEGLHAAFAFPVMLKSGIFGVIELFSREVRDADRGLLQMMAAIGSQVAQFVERTRAEDALRDAREKLAQAAKIASLAELSATIAHEINQPLQAIVANGHASLRWLDATPPNIEKAIHTAQRVVRDGNAAADVVSRIRALFKHAAPSKVDLDINVLILQLCNLMADEIQGNGVSLETELGEDVSRIQADAVQIQQVIVNLVRNAIEAMAATMERPKPLWIRSRREEGNVVVDVQDRGVGLADSENIFEPFITSKKSGLGMGLAICRSIIEAHAGRIWAARNPGRGVTFSFSLPIENGVTR